jgi:hypothetical protein
MATSFKLKAVEELKAAKKIARQQEAEASAAYEEKKAAKKEANEKKLAEKMARISQPKPTPVVKEVVEEKPKPKSKAKPKVTVKKKGRPAKAKK